MTSRKGSVVKMLRVVITVCLAWLLVQFVTVLQISLTVSVVIVVMRLMVREICFVVSACVSMLWLTVLALSRRLRERLGVIEVPV